MAKKLVKKQDGGPTKSEKYHQKVVNKLTNKIDRVERRADRAEKKSEKAYSNYTSTPGTNEQGHWENKTIRLSEKTARLRKKSDDLKYERSKFTDRQPEPKLKKGGSIKKKK